MVLHPALNPSDYTSVAANRAVSAGDVNEDNFLLPQLRVNMGFISYHVMIWTYELDSNEFHVLSYAQRPNPLTIIPSTLVFHPRQMIP